jgi:pSer/pThr/pTyr-binding forkhead associated (FHA) protein
MRFTNQPMARLVVLSEGFTGLSHELKVEKTTIGRLEDNVFSLGEPSVSSHHCELVRQGDEYLVRDLNSTNGTFINGEQIKEAVLKAGQILRLGQVEIRLESGAPVPAGSPGKKPLDKTMVIPQGVKVQELDQGTRPVVGTSTAFSKKSNRINMIFLVIGIVLGLIIIALLLVTLGKMN